jgi:tetratricopeptide (TPR) repeat protein
MEYVPGLSLRELLSRGGYIPALGVVEIMGQVCAALDRAHEQGIVHRNLKPDNIIIAEEEDGTPRVKVLELGMANLRQAAAEHEKQVGDVVMTDQGPVVGTMEYMSPEQATGTLTRIVDGRSDIYSVGVMMFEAMTGELPIVSDDPMGLLSQKQGVAANELLCATVLKALQRDPDYRFQSATEMIAALREISHSLGKPASVQVESASGSEAVRVSFSSQASQQVIKDAQDQPPTIAARQDAEHAAAFLSERGYKPPPKHALTEASESTDRTIDEIRKAWPQMAGQASGRRQARRKQVRTSLLVVAVAAIVLLASWVIYHDRERLTPPQERGTAGQSDLAAPGAPSREATSNPNSHEVQSPLVVPSQDNQQPTIMKPSPNPPLPGASDDAKGPPAQPAAGGTSHQQKAPAATAVRGGDRLPSASTDLAGSTAADSREAEIKKKIAVGWLLVERGNHRGAIESFNEALKLDPSNVEAQAALRLARFAIQNPGVEVLPSQTPADRTESKKGQP